MENTGMSDKQLTIKILSDLTQTIDQLQYHISMQDSFLREHFRQYASYGPSTHGLLQTIKTDILNLQKITLSNKDNAHLLSPVQEEPRPQQQRAIRYQPDQWGYAEF
jgi:hypothetical protein